MDSVMDSVASHYNYWIYIVLMMVGFYGIVAKRNLLKQAASLALFQTGIFLFYISMSVVDGGTVPVYAGADQVYMNPLPHVLILTAIVVSVSVLAVAVALIINIQRAFGTIEEDALFDIETKDNP